MNCPNLALTKAQQAPLQPSGWMPPWATVAQTVRSGPVHWALRKAQLMTCGSTQATMRMPRMVRMVSLTEPTKFFFYEVFRDEAAFAEHSNAPHFKTLILEQAVPRLAKRERTQHKFVA